MDIRETVTANLAPLATNGVRWLLADTIAHRLGKMERAGVLANLERVTVDGEFLNADDAAPHEITVALEVAGLTDEQRQYQRDYANLLNGDDFGIFFTDVHDPAAVAELRASALDQCATYGRAPVTVYERAVVVA